MSLSKTIYIESANSSKEYNLDAVHAKEGTLFLNETITADVAVQFVSVMKYMAEKEKEVTLYINCKGGEVNAGLVMYDVIQAYPHTLNIICTGIAASMAAVLLAGGQKGRRFILPHSKVMIHEPLIMDGFGGSATTIEKKAQSILEIKAIINGILSEATGKSIEEIDSATSYDNFMDADEAVAFGICDKIRNIY
ncbi:MAG: ATP-dependent Clp protease proteolytic subunit [Ruminococcus sp.]|nr:ATP-dependent Clp protease proteolytic subunit [Ruminococcus sp.]